MSLSLCLVLHVFDASVPMSLSRVMAGEFIHTGSHEMFLRACPVHIHLHIGLHIDRDIDLHIDMDILAECCCHHLLSCKTVTVTLMLGGCVADS